MSARDDYPVLAEAARNAQLHCWTEAAAALVEIDRLREAVAERAMSERPTGRSGWKDWDPAVTISEADYMTSPTVVRRERLRTGNEQTDMLIVNPTELWLEFYDNGQVRWIECLKQERPWEASDE